MTTEANPAATSTDGNSTQTEEIDLRALAAQADAGVDVDAIIAEKSAKKTTTTPATPAPAEGTKKDGEPQPDAGKKPDAAPTEDPNKDKKTKSEYELSKERKKAADEERFDRNWKKLNEEKEALRREREAIAAERTRAPAPKPEPAKDKRGLTAADYERTAHELEADGDIGAARAARSKAAELKAKDEEAANAANSSPAPSAPVRDGEFDERAAAEEARQLMTEDPSLQKADNPLVMEANRLMRDKDWGPLFRRPGGIRAAVEAAKVSMEARAATGLRTENAALKKELEQLRRATDPGGSPAVPRKSAQAGAGKPLSDAELYQLAEAADREG